MTGTAGVSVIIAAWNAAETIERAVRSALDQPETLQVVVADDRSDDGTADVVRSLGDRVDCHRLDRNGGPAAARNAALALCRAPWVAVLDADDTFAPGRLTRLLQAAATTGAVVVADNCWRALDGAPERTLFIDEPVDGASVEVGLGDYFRQNLLFNSPRALGYLKPVFDRGFLIRNGLRYDERLRVGEDFALVANCLALGARFTRVRSPGYVYTVSRPGSVSNRLRSKAVAAMIEADEAFAARFSPTLGRADLDAVKARRRSLEKGLHFLQSVEALKAGRVGSALATLARDPAALGHYHMPVRLLAGRLWERRGLKG